MRTRVLRLSVLGLATAVLAACATGEQWTTWRQHGSHFASAEHMVFSLHNTGGGKPRVTRQDITLARDEGWWGIPVTVSQDDILRR